MYRVQSFYQVTTIISSLPYKKMSDISFLVFLRLVFDVFFHSLFEWNCLWPVFTKTYRLSVFFAHFTKGNYPAYDRPSVVDNLLITSPPCLEFVSGVGCLKTGNPRHLLIPATESGHEQELIGYKVFISNNLCLIMESACR